MLGRVDRLLAGLALIACALVLHLGAAYPQSERPLVYLVPIEGMIDLGLVPFVKRALNEASEAGAAAVVFEIETFGGRVDAAVQIRDALLSAPMPTIAFVNKRAISAGALIALSSKTLVMAPGGTIGAAAPVLGGMPGAETTSAGEKTVSYLRKEFRATAEASNRPLLLAEAMVDTDVVIPDVTEKGKLLTLSTEEALQHKMADLRANTLENALEQLGLAGAEIRAISPHWAEYVVRFLTHPVISSLLISVALLGIMVEIRTPGLGVAGIIGATSLALFFGGHWLVQLAGWEEVLLAGAGIALLMAEIFLIPGFGIAGALGITALLGAMVWSMTGSGDTAAFIAQAVWRVVLAMLAALLAGFVLLRFLPRLPVARRLVLETDLGTGPEYGSAPLSDQLWLGKQGRAVSILRPAGIADIGGERVDVVSNGEMIEPGTPIEVAHVDGNRIVVRRLVNDLPQSNIKETQ